LGPLAEAEVGDDDHAGALVELTRSSARWFALRKITGGSKLEPDSPHTRHKRQGIAVRANTLQSRPVRLTLACNAW
jgi:hypothetical protein